MEEVVFLPGSQDQDVVSGLAFQFSGAAQGSAAAKCGYGCSDDRLDDYCNSVKYDRSKQFLWQHGMNNNNDKLIMIIKNNHKEVKKSS